MHYFRINRVVLFVFLIIQQSIAIERVGLSRKQAVSAAMPLAVMVVGDFNCVDRTAMLDYLLSDFSFSGQCKVTIHSLLTVPNKKIIKMLFEQGMPLALFINENSAEHALEWRLYDTLQSNMVAGKKVKIGSCNIVSVVHTIANSVWLLLTGNHGCFGSKIAYCKEIVLPNGRTAKQVIIADIDGNNPRVLVNVPTVHTGLRWNNDKYHPLLFYSQYTASNIRMLAVDMHKKTQVVSDFDGINMLPTFSPDGQQVVYCLSKGTGKCQLYSGTKKGIELLCTVDGQALSPTFSPDGTTIYFCSDHLGIAHIYAYSLVTQLLVPITCGVGYAVSPACHPYKELLAYTRKINGYTQIFMWDKITANHQQITYDNTYKDNCSWSPCGQYIAYSVEQGSQLGIAVWSMATKQQKMITPLYERCSFPAWSPVL